MYIYRKDAGTVRKEGDERMKEKHTNPEREREEKRKVFMYTNTYSYIYIQTYFCAQTK